MSGINVKYETELMIELCALYKRVIIRESQLGDALLRIRELEALSKNTQAPRKGTTRPAQEPAAVHPREDNSENPPDPRIQGMTEFQVSVRPANPRKREPPRFIDSNIVESKPPPSTPWSAKSVNKNTQTPFTTPNAGSPNTASERGTKGRESSKRVLAAALLNAKTPPPPPPISSAMRDAIRPPFIPASREGSTPLFNIHSIRQKKERDRLIEEPTRIRHRPVVQQPSRDTR